MNGHFTGQQHLGFGFSQEGLCARLDRAPDGFKPPNIEVLQGCLCTCGCVRADRFRDRVGGGDSGDDGRIAGEDLGEFLAGYIGGIWRGRHVGRGKEGRERRGEDEWRKGGKRECCVIMTCDGRLG